MPNHLDWLRIAQSDLDSAKTLLKPEEEIVSSALYFSQQCAEKALKAYLVFYKKFPPKTHDFTKLALLCSDIDKEFIVLLNETYDINPFSSATRYPDDSFIFPDVTQQRTSFWQNQKRYSILLLIRLINKTPPHSTVTDLAKFRGLSIGQPRSLAI